MSDFLGALLICVGIIIITLATGVSAAWLLHAGIS
jgi:hypothetical protein